MHASYNTDLVSLVAQARGDVNAAAVVLQEKNDVKGESYWKPRRALIRDLPGAQRLRRHMSDVRGGGDLLLQLGGS